MKRKELELLHHMLELGSVSAAAKAIHTTQPNASKILKNLEDRVGFRLFERIDGRMLPTEEGRQFAEHAESALLSLLSLEARARNIRQMRLGSLALGAMPLLSRKWLPQILADFMAAHPAVHCSLHTRSSRRLLDLATQRQLDLSFGMLPLESDSTECKKLFDIDMLVAVPPNHPYAQRRVLRPQDFEQQDYIAASMLDRAREHIEDFFKEHGVRPRERGECSLPGVATQLVAKGVGLALVDQLTADEDETKSVVYCRLEPRLQVSVWMIRPSTSPKSRIVRAFERIVIEKAQADGLAPNPTATPQ